MSDKSEIEQTLMMSHRSEPDGAPNQNNVNLLSFTMTSSPGNNGHHTSTSPNKSLNTSKESSFSSDKSVSPVLGRTSNVKTPGGLDSSPPDPSQPSNTSPVQLRSSNGSSSGPSSLTGTNLSGNGCQYSGTGILDPKIRPGEFVMRVLFSEFTSLAEKKIELVMMEPPVSQIYIYSNYKIQRLILQITKFIRF